MFVGRMTVLVCATSFVFLSSFEKDGPDASTKTYFANWALLMSFGLALGLFLIFFLNTDLEPLWIFLTVVAGCHALAIMLAARSPPSEKAEFAIVLMTAAAAAFFGTMVAVMRELEVTLNY